MLAKTNSLRTVTTRCGVYFVACKMGGRRGSDEEDEEEEEEEEVVVVVGGGGGGGGGGSGGGINFFSRGKTFKFRF